MVLLGWLAWERQSIANQVALQQDFTDPKLHLLSSILHMLCKKKKK